MGITAPCLNAIDHVVHNTQYLKERKGFLKAISIGYPDILVPRDKLILMGINVDNLEWFPVEKAKEILSYHNKSKELTEVPTTESVLKELGIPELICVDIVAHKGTERVVDMNYPCKTLSDYDIVLDLGTAEHCFNVPAFMMNLVDFCKKDGVIINWNPFFSPNHGFYNFSPTFYKDWYETIGAKILHYSMWSKNPKDLQQDINNFDVYIVSQKVIHFGKIKDIISYNNRQIKQTTNKSK
jgi:hypothetical protein